VVIEEEEEGEDDDEKEEACGERRMEAGIGRLVEEEGMGDLGPDEWVG
jgi:hypothetical protein